MTEIESIPRLIDLATSSRVEDSQQNQLLQQQELQQQRSHSIDKNPSAPQPARINSRTYNSHTFGSHNFTIEPNRIRRRADNVYVVHTTPYSVNARAHTFHL